MFLGTFNESQTIWDVVVKSAIIPNPTILPPKSTLNEWMEHFNIHLKGFKKCEIVKGKVKMNKKSCYIPVLGGYQNYSQVSLRHHLGILIWTSHNILWVIPWLKTWCLFSHKWKLDGENQIKKTIKNYQNWGEISLTLLPGLGSHVLCTIHKELAFSIFIYFEVQPKSFKFGFPLFIFDLPYFYQSWMGTIYIFDTHQIWFSQNRLQKLSILKFEFFEQTDTLD